jgi:diguanylate cyclase
MRGPMRRPSMCTNSCVQALHTPGIRNSSTDVTDVTRRLRAIEIAWCHSQTLDAEHLRRHGDADQGVRPPRSCHSADRNMMMMSLMPDQILHIPCRTEDDANREPEQTLTLGAISAGGDDRHTRVSDDGRRDCEELIDTVKSSLWGLLDASPGGDVDIPVPDDEARVRSTAIQGTVALERLQTNLAQAFATRDQLERDIQDARRALESMRAELAGTRAGERQARHLAAHDQLTGLANRGHFQEQLCHALAMHALSGTRLAVMFIDLDGFKPVNDTFGHAAGDTLLRIVAHRLSHAVRTHDLVSRLGGDEFACLIPGIDTSEQASVLAAKLRDAIRAPCRIGHQMVQIDASIGIVVDMAGAGDSEELLLKADMAMYRAKRERTGIAFYDA